MLRYLEGEALSLRMVSRQLFLRTRRYNNHPASTTTTVITPGSIRGDVEDSLDLNLNTTGQQVNKRKASHSPPVPSHCQQIGSQRLLTIRPSQKQSDDDTIICSGVLELSLTIPAQRPKPFPPQSRHGAATKPAVSHADENELRPTPKCYSHSHSRKGEREIEKQKDQQLSTQQLEAQQKPAHDTSIGLDTPSIRVKVAPIHPPGNHSPFPRTPSPTTPFVLPR
ncbi:Protein of unknown function [Pyronema omphalodes CBS 100304]|uniref:Uncharacterized protein n=1 Tax=Pyronema omphalodes (strain CBS 100304) TaxID=1076935 RepID=U4LPB6_PYROM|nr:Protein of unknown function [Pyronema omphalodes CBS 100304]